MSGSKEGRTYEFTPDQNLMLQGLARGLTKLGVAVLVAGLLSVAYIMISFFDPVSVLDVSDAKHYLLATVDYGLWVLISLLVVYLSVTIIGLARPIRMITSTAGADVSFLMDFVSRLTGICNRAFVILLVICLFLLVSLLMMILVF